MAARPARVPQFRKRGVFMDWDKSVFLLARMHLIYLKSIPKSQAQTWSESPVIRPPT